MQADSPPAELSGKPKFNVYPFIIVQPCYLELPFITLSKHFFKPYERYVPLLPSKVHIYRSILLCIQSILLSEKQWHPSPVLLLGKSHRWRSLVGYSPWGREELDTTERLHFHFSLSCIGEGNGNPLQCSCLENPRDRGAW